MGEDEKGRSGKVLTSLVISIGAALLIAGLVFVISGSYFGLIPFGLGVVLIVLKVILGLERSFKGKTNQELEPGAPAKNTAFPRADSNDGIVPEASLWQTKMPWYVSSRPVANIVLGLAGMIWGAAWISNARSMPYSSGLASNEILITRTYSLALLVLCLLVFILGILCLVRPVSYIAVNVVLGILLAFGGLCVVPIASRVLRPGGLDYLVVEASIYLNVLPFILAGLFVACMNLPVWMWVRKAAKGRAKSPYARGYAVAISLAVLGILVFAAVFPVLYWAEGPRRREEREALSARLENTMLLRPAAAQGMVYVGKDYHPYLYALDARTGEEVWRFETGSEVVGPPVVGGGIVFAVGEDNGFLFALDASSGELLWKREFTNLRESSPVAYEGMVYIAENHGPLHAMDAATGETVWEEYAYGPMGDPAADYGTVYALGEGNEGRILYALDARNGSELWRCGEGLRLTASPVVSRGLVYAIDRGDNLYVFDAGTGEAKRDFSVDGRSGEPPVVNGAAVYMTRLDASGLLKLDGETGNVEWLFEKWGARIPVVCDGMVYLTAGDTLYALDAASGGEIWRLDGAHFTPAVLGGDVFAGSPSRYLYAVDAATGAVRWKAVVGISE